VDSEKPEKEAHEGNEGHEELNCNRDASQFFMAFLSCSSFLGFLREEQLLSEHGSHGCSRKRREVLSPRIAATLKTYCRFSVSFLSFGFSVASVASVASVVVYGR
jgi:hypothetical protein